MKWMTCLLVVLISAPMAYSQNWSLSGNTGVTSSQFLGTLDANPLRFRVKNIPSGIIDSVRYNTAFGYFSFPVNTTGNYNAALGSKTLNKNTTGYNNTAIGSYALLNNSSGYGNSGIGAYALLNNSVGASNTALGAYALVNNTTGYQNTSAGESSMNYNTTGYNNAAFGRSALSSNSAGHSNTAVGYNSVFANLSGYRNTGVGLSSLSSTTNGYKNTAVGASSLLRNAGGALNTAVGDSAMVVNTSGNSNVAVGYRADFTAGTFSNAISIGSLSRADGTNRVRIGNASTSSIGGNAAWTNFSDGRIKKNVKENIPGLSFINRLRPVSYQLDVDKQYALLGMNDLPEDKSRYDVEKISFSGFIAQEVDAAAKEIGYNFSGVDASGVIMGLRYSEFVVPAVKAIQELSASLKEKDELIQQLQMEMNELRQMIQQLHPSASTSTKTSATSDKASLGQNSPNPFSGITRIEYAIPAGVRHAVLNFYARNGALLHTAKLSGHGRSTYQLQGLDWAAGVYSYSLVADGKVIDTRQMVLER